MALLKGEMWILLSVQAVILLKEMERQLVELGWSIDVNVHFAQRCSFHREQFGLLDLLVS